MADNVNGVNCADIYAEEMKRSLKTLKRFREAWLRSPSIWNAELFQYADLDFYFYRFAIDCQEQSTESLLTAILYKVMDRYGLSFEVPDDRRNAPFVFIICEREKRVGCTYTDFCSDKDINGIFHTYNVDEAYIIRTWKPGRSDEWISRENKHYRDDGLKLKAIPIADFFEKYFGSEEYNTFLQSVEEYLRDARDITGYKPIRFLSSMNLASQKAYEEKVLADWQYDNYIYQIIDSSNRKIQDYLYLSTPVISSTILGKIRENYVVNKLFETMIDSNEYAESFITSEWLYHSLKDKKNFDYTSVISGYLKSIEQLLYRIVMVNVDNSCKISMSGASNVRKKAYDNNVKAYEKNDDTWNEVVVSNRTEYLKKRFLYIDLTTEQTEYMDSSIGTFEYFLRNNPHLFVDPILAKTTADMVSCFRTECRNRYFHTHNVNDWSVVEKTRSNAIYLYFILLGGYIIPQTKIEDLGIGIYDKFDGLCKKIREFGHYNPEFIFEYDNGRRINLIYDFINNTIEYTDGGIEHYKSLLFCEVEDFSLEAYEKLDEGIGEEQKVFLTRENLPYKIYAVHRNHELEEIVF